MPFYKSETLPPEIAITERALILLAGNFVSVGELSSEAGAFFARRRTLYNRSSNVG